jgi:hypothetical protein
MDHCQKQRIKFTSLRGGLSLLTGVFSWFLLSFAASKFGWSLTPTHIALLSAALTVTGWFSTRSMFKFTEECMSMTKGRTVRNVRPEKSNAPLDRLAARPRAFAPATPPATCPIEMVQGGKLFEKGKITVNIATGDKGRSVVVTMRQIGARQFKGNNGNNGLRARLEKIGGVKWSFPKNDPANGVRTMEGVITSSDNARIAAELIAVASSQD